MTLTERETRMLGLVLRLVKKNDGPAGIADIADSMSYIKGTGKGKGPTDQQRRKHAKGVLTLLRLKLGVEGIKLLRVSRLGTGAEGEYDFENKNHRNAAARFLAKCEEALADKKLEGVTVIPRMFA